MIFSTLLRNEWLKARKRPAFWVAMVFFFVMNLLGWGGSYYQARGNPGRSFGLPGAWRQIFDDLTIVGTLFGSVVIILLVASEFSWRTARQNVIDGLTKEQFFLAKLMVVPGVILFVMASVIVSGAGFALLGTDFSTVEEPLFGAAQWSYLLGWFVAFMGYGGLALLCATGIRNSGPAMAVWFLYIGPGEALVGELRRLGDGVRQAMEYLPTQTFNRLMEYAAHDRELFQVMVDAARANDRTPPETVNLLTTYSVSLAWIGLFIGAAFLWFRQRDL